MIVMNYEQKINDNIKNASSIVIYSNGKKAEFARGQEKFNLLLNNILSTFETAHIMPAFGVSLHAETLAERQNGSWVEIKFDGVQIANELPFSALLFRLDNCYGINLIRLNDGEYSGRCIYLDFGEQKDLSAILKDVK